MTVSRQQFNSLGEHLQVRHRNTCEIKLHGNGAAIVLEITQAGKICEASHATSWEQTARRN